MMRISPGSTAILPSSVKNSSPLRRVKVVVLMRRGDEIVVRRRADLRVDVARGRHREKAGHKIHCLVGNRHRPPPQLMAV
jgi:hypothetical protein